ncbi:conserved hypothetical protein [Bathymodiolus platifrons methanotrophic gill symbiont]|uniref:glycosyltransferase family 4 protein n=1 Tax=Bathymodiolus platifrons methanotrophic gill symbiont TaxID=113268 RepID=UPI000B4181C2|nr:glycosyltransferase family 4 protein [Bathymodiolus platifrons methanotrophic gill symbiont]GAW86437.1 conserved hypothetical protein [Bathymodiolus platifrons methanotrophic gill symbiont]GFO74384.1 hypothetical protein BPLS_P1064 [Bathymodiolus platifrons methanotrophic gill symbiont]
MKNIHIIIVNDFAFINGGASNVAITSALALDQAGYSVSFFAAVGPVIPELVNSNVNVVCLEQCDILHDPNRLRAMTQGIWNAKATKAMDNLLTKWADHEVIVHMHAFVKALSSSIINVCHKHKAPMVLTLHDYFTACPNGGFYDYQQKQLCLRQAMSVDCLKTNCDVRSYKHKIWRIVRNAVQLHICGIPGSIKHFIYISELSKKILQPFLPETAKLHYVPNPIDVIKSDRVEVEKNIYYIFIGRLSPEKGIDTFCETFSKLNLPAIVVGDGEGLIDLKQKYPSIEFTGWLDKAAISNIIQKAKALVFPTHWYETQGLVVYEALAHGIPAIVPEHCCATEGVEHGQNGLLYNDTDKLGLESAIQQFDNMPSDEVKILSETAYNRFWNKADDINQHVNNLISTYNYIIRGVAIFAKACFGHPSPSKQQKLNATTYASGGPDSSSSPRPDPTRGRNIGSK